MRIVVFNSKTMKILSTKFTINLYLLIFSLFFLINNLSGFILFTNIFKKTEIISFSLSNCVTISDLNIG